jgi:hypothetical protein
VHEEERGPEQPRLFVGSGGQRSLADPGREAQKVSDQRAATGLTAEDFPIHHQGVQALRRRVHGGAQARGARADDDHVERVRDHRGVDPEGVGDVGVRRVGQRRGTDHEDGRQVLLRQQCLRQQLAPGGAARLVQVVQDPGPGQQIA